MALHMLGVCFTPELYPWTAFLSQRLSNRIKTEYVAQVGLELRVIFLSQPPWC